ncbi:MAG: lipid-A-disaccharide synthase [Gammaproteobacteria bacterium]|jgi:lipid-A-disaccharide synthase|nr:lipid-A-disaccharide synthase [Gammaproteobacteria bacterium]
MPRIAIVAGEVSGDRLGAGLIRAVQARRPDIRFSGIAGPLMQAAGAEAWRHSDELAVMGLAEVVRHLPRLRRIIREFEARLLADPPDLYIGIDAPDFNLRIERTVRAAGIPTVHYVSPSVWAWRSGRVRVLREACDMVLCLLPFEADFLHQHQVPAVFVGHPLADELPADPDPQAARLQLGLPATGRVVAIMPGSRVGELERLGPVFAATARWLKARLPDVVFVAPMARPDLRERFAVHWQQATGGLPVHLVDGQSHAAMAAADAILLASGTATLEAMLLNRPMVVAYRISPLSYALVKLFRLIHVQHMALPNLLANQRLVPEFVQAQVEPGTLGPALLELLENPANRRQLGQRFHELASGLRQAASERAADTVLAMLERS